MAELARQLGVSTSAVSQVFSQKGKELVNLVNTVPENCHEPVYLYPEQSPIFPMIMLPSKLS